MTYFKPNQYRTLQGVLFVALFAILAIYLAQLRIFLQFGISPLIIGIVLGMFYGNTLRTKSPEKFQSGVLFSTKFILRAGIVFYGFRLTFQNINEVGIVGLTVSVSIVVSTFIIGYFIGHKLLKLDKDTTILISAGSSICGAAAVLATEPLLKSAHYKTSIAVATVVVFGTISMFLYPFLYQSGVLDLSPSVMGIYLGGTLHEVAHVVGAGNAIDSSTANTAVIVKMLRVMLLAPFLVVLSFWLKSKVKSTNNKNTTKITIPWFAVGFIGVVAFNSLGLLSVIAVNVINQVDTFLLTMAMTALGMETRIEKFKGIGFKPIYLAGILFMWLLLGGYAITHIVIHLI